MGPMRKFSRWAASAALAAGSALALPASADKLLFSGTHAIKFAHNGVLEEVSASGTGVAIVNGGSGGSTLNTVELTRPFAKIDATVPATATGGIDEIQFQNVRINPLLAGPDGIPGEFAPLLAAAKGTMVMSLTRSTLPAAGTIRLCNLSSCPGAIKLTQTNLGKAIGPGVGGTFTTTGMSSTMLTVMGNPWTVNSTEVSYRTTMGGIASFSLAGTVKGPLGMTGTTLDLTSLGMGGTLQLVSGFQTTCTGCPGNNSPRGHISRLTINFQPEPGRLSLLLAGAATVALLGRARRANRR